MVSHLVLLLGIRHCQVFEWSHTWSCCSGSGTARCLKGLTPGPAARDQALPGVWMVSHLVLLLGIRHCQVFEGSCTIFRAIRLVQNIGIFFWCTFSCSCPGGPSRRRADGRAGETEGNYWGAGANLRWDVRLLGQEVVFKPENTISLFMEIIKATIW